MQSKPTRHAKTAGKYNPFEEKGNKLKQTKTKTDVKIVLTLFHMFKKLNKRLNMFSIGMKYIKTNQIAGDKNYNN